MMHQSSTIKGSSIDSAIHVRSAAKVNLTLDILERLPNGYHELASIIHTIGLWDKITIRASNTWGFTCANTGVPVEDNLCLKAARLWVEAAHEAGLELNFSAAEINLQKNIPIGAGLGGGSGNAAAILVALNEHRLRRGETVLDEAKMHQIAIQLGADVPLFLWGGCLLMEGIGERLTALPPVEGWLVVVKPPVHGDTGEIYKAWDESPVPTKYSSEQLRFELEISSETMTSLKKIGAALNNDLSEPARRCGIPVEETLNALQTTLPLGASMTGSGSACFAVYSTRCAAVEAYDLIAARSDTKDWFIKVAPFCSSGFIFQPFEPI
jgi:4-diphosphocytidyl-2-C-methyl-D-erythritol kinase